jgi:hypothetical protein
MQTQTSTSETVASKFLRLYGKPDPSKSNAWLAACSSKTSFDAWASTGTGKHEADDLNVDIETMVAHVKSVFLQQGHRKTQPIPIKERHNPRLTFGLELEMVIHRKPEHPDAGLDRLLKSFNTLNSILPRQFPAELYRGGRPDRSKFLIMRDES